MTRPCRRITLHLSQIGLTLGFTFTAVDPFHYPVLRARVSATTLFGLLLLVAVDDATPG